MQTAWFSNLWGEVGQIEIAGKENNPRILEYLLTCDIPDSLKGNICDEIAWCSAALNWAIVRAGYKGTNSLLARSWLKWGIALSEPREHCIVVLERGLAWQGHVGIFMSDGENNIYVLAGNQHNRVNIEAFPKTQVLGYRWPETALAINAPERRVFIRGVDDVESIDQDWEQARQRAIAYSSHYIQKAAC